MLPPLMALTRGLDDLGDEARGHGGVELGGGHVEARGVGVGGDPAALGGVVGDVEGF